MAANLFGPLAPRRPVYGPRFCPAARIIWPAPNDRRLGDPVGDDEVVRAIRDVPEHRSVFGTQTYPEMFYASLAAGTAYANSTTETSLLTGFVNQPTIAPPCFGAVPGASGRSLKFRGWGLLSNTGTPTLTFKFYSNTTQGVSNTAGTNIGVTAAITTASGVTNKVWGFELDLICRTPGQGSTNATLFVVGRIWSDAGFASPFSYTITPGTGDSATVTATIDGAVTQYFNATATWSAASASNTMTLQGLQAWAWN